MATEADHDTELAKEAARLVVEALSPTLIRLETEIREAKRDVFQELRSFTAQNNVDRASAELRLDGIQADIKTLRERVENMGQVDRHEAHAITTTLNGHSSRLRSIDDRLYEVKDDSRTIVERLDRLPAE